MWLLGFLGADGGEAGMEVVGVKGGSRPLTPHNTGYLQCFFHVALPRHV